MENQLAKLMGQLYAVTLEKIKNFPTEQIFLNLRHRLVGACTSKYGKIQKSRYPRKKMHWIQHSLCIDADIDADLNVVYAENAFSKTLFALSTLFRTR